MCQVTETAITSDSPHDYTGTTYDGMGRVWTVSNPCRSMNDSTYGLTTYTYDPLGRTTSVANPDTSASRRRERQTAPTSALCLARS